MFKIEKNKPMMPGVRKVWPFGDMEVGDYFAISVDLYTMASSSASYYGKHNNKKFPIRREGDGYRVWRTK